MIVDKTNQKTQKRNPNVCISKHMLYLWKEMKWLYIESNEKTENETKDYICN